MKPVLLLLSLLIPGTLGDLGPGDSNLDLNLDLNLNLDLDRLLHRVDPRFLSVTIDANLASEERFMLLLSSVKIRTLAKALSPAFLRFGGTRQDFMIFHPKGNKQQPRNTTSEESCERTCLPWWLEDRLKRDWRQQQLLLMKEEQQANFRRLKFTELTVDTLHSFSSCSDLDLIFGLNALLRTEDNRWNGSNAALLLDYCQSRRYRMSWELGNEPNSFEKKAGIRVDGHQLGLDFTHLRTMMSQSKFYRNAGLFGPDVGQPKDHSMSMNILEGFLQSGGKAINACTWHHYYVNSRETSLEDFLDLDILDSLALKIKAVVEKVKSVSPGKPVWLGETSSAYGGGASGLSDKFVAGFMWLDKLGLGAALGLDGVMRQVLVGSGSYHLVDDNLDPLPDYWLSLLYKRLVGPEVLKVEVFSTDGWNKRVRVYLHCANKKSFSSGSVTLFSLNLSKKPARIGVPSLLSSSTVTAFVLQSDQPGQEGLLSSSVKLNGVVLKMLDDKTLPDLTGAPLPPAEHLDLPPYSLAFFVFSEAGAAACS